MESYDEEKAVKGLKGEDVLNDWFKRQNLPYLYVEQNKDSFTSLFTNSVKRPDFLLLLQSIGLIAVDAKNYDLYYENYFTLNIDVELQRMIAFERLFRIPVWYAYLHPKNKDWYWISGLNAIEVGYNNENRKTGDKFIAIHLDYFARIKTSEDLGKLYTMKLGSVKEVSK